jgi:hypothetical protein
MGAGLEEAVGLGVTIALTDLFSEAADKIISRFEALEQRAGSSAHAVRQSIEGMKLGLGLLGAGSALLAPLVLIGQRAGEAADKAERLQIAYESLAPQGEALLANVRAIETELRVFPTDQVLEAGKRLLAMGMASEKIPGLLRAAGIAATVMDESLESVVGRLQMLSVYAEQGVVPPRMLAQFGVSMADLAAEGIRMAKGKLLSSSEELMDAVGRVIERRMGEAAARLRQGGIGIEAETQRQYRAFYEGVGGALQPVEDGIKEGFLQLLKDADLAQVGRAFGEGLAAAYSLLSPVGAALKSLAGGVAGLVNAHPGLVKLGTALAGIIGSTLAAAGAIVLLSSAVRFGALAFRLLSAAATESLRNAWASLVPLLPTILPLVAAASLVYLAWEHNFGGLRDTVTKWWDALRLVVGGVVELFSDDGKGQVGSIPAALHDKLVEKGLWGVTKAIFLWGERVVELFAGIWETVRGAVAFLAAAFRVLITPIEWLIRGFGWLTDRLWPTNEAFTGVNDVSQTSLDVMHTLGNVLGALVVGFAAYRAGLIAVRAATLAWQAAQWAINLALSANPIGIVILLVGLLVAGVAAAIAYIDELRESFEDMLDVAPMRWLMKAVGVIPEGATDADIDDAMGGRGREHADKRRRRQELGRDDFVSRLVDNLGLPGAVDLHAPPGITAQESSSRSPAGYLGQLNASLAAAAAGAKRHASPDQHINVYLDGQQIHGTVVRHEESLANRAGD